MIKNIIISALTIFLLISLFVAHSQKVRADNMTVLAEQKGLEAEQFRIQSEHARIRAEEALKEAAFQRQEAVQQVAILEAQLKKHGGLTRN